MPTYEYRCKTCSHEFETVQSFSDDALTECPECGGSLRKVFGNIGVTFKGSGFYKTDHGSRSKSSNGSSESKSDATTTTESSTSSSGGSSSGGSSSSESSSSAPAAAAAS